MAMSILSSLVFVEGWVLGLFVGKIGIFISQKSSLILACIMSMVFLIILVHGDNSLYMHICGYPLCVRRQLPVHM